MGSKMGSKLSTPHSSSDPQSGNDSSKPAPTLEEVWNDLDGGPPVCQITAVVIGFGQVRMVLHMGNWEFNSNYNIIH